MSKEKNEVKKEKTQEMDKSSDSKTIRTTGFPKKVIRKHEKGGRLDLNS